MGQGARSEGAEVGSRRRDIAQGVGSDRGGGLVGEGRWGGGIRTFIPALTVHRPSRTLGAPPPTDHGRLHPRRARRA